MGTLEGKVAFITGANSGVGQKTAELFLAEGAKLALLDRNKDWMEGFAAEHENVIAFHMDLKVEADVKAAMAKTIEVYGKLDVLCNIAGMFDFFRPITEMDDELLEDVMGSNMYGDLYTMRCAVPHMIENGGGSIVNIASIAGQTGFRGGLAYTMSKHGIVGLTKNTAFAYALQGIRCNAISPSGINTPMLFGGHGEASEFGMERYVLGRACKPRNCEPEEVADLVLFLASDKSRAINGAVINIDVGCSAY